LTGVGCGRKIFKISPRPSKGRMQKIIKSPHSEKKKRGTCQGKRNPRRFEPASPGSGNPGPRSNPFFSVDKDCCRQSEKRWRAKISLCTPRILGDGRGERNGGGGMRGCLNVPRQLVTVNVGGGSKLLRRRKGRGSASKGMPQTPGSSSESKPNSRREIQHIHPNGTCEEEGGFAEGQTNAPCSLKKSQAANSSQEGRIRKGPAGRKAS